MHTEKAKRPFFFCTPDVHTYRKRFRILSVLTNSALWNQESNENSIAKTRMDQQKHGKLSLLKKSVNFSVIRENETIQRPKIFKKMFLEKTSSSLL